MKKSKKIIIGAIALAIIAAIIVAFNLTKVTYTKEFNYLPQYTDMKVVQFTPPKNEQFGNAVYYVSNEDYQKFLTNYQKVLQRDGWKITQDKKPENLEATKDKHIVRINVVNAKGKLTVLIWTK